MPKILILFAGQPTAIVNTVADGARSVRFSEVELRSVGNPEGASAGIHQTLAGVDEIVPYDAVIVAASASAEIGLELAELVRHAAASAPRTTWQNKVGAAFVPETGVASVDVWPTLKALGALGMLVVAPSGPGADAAKELGVRVAQVVGWVTHARSHHHHAH